jgi:hypothetical protein
MASVISSGGGDFVLYQQLATLQLHDLEMVDRRMSAGFDYFRFQGPMPSSVRFASHRIKGQRCFSKLGGAAVAWPLAARAQQPAMLLVGYIGPASPDDNHCGLAVFWQCQQGLVAPASNWPLRLD